MNWVKHLTSPPHQLKYNALIGMLLLVFSSTVGGSQFKFEKFKNFVVVLASILFYLIITLKCVSIMTIPTINEECVEIAPPHFNTVEQDRDLGDTRKAKS